MTMNRGRAVVNSDYGDDGDHSDHSNRGERVGAAADRSNDHRRLPNTGGTQRGTDE